MTDRSRRDVLAAGALAAIAGCTSRGDPSTAETPDETTTPPHSLEGWERSTDCGPMHDTVVSVEATADAPGDAAPIEFEELSAEERSVLETVTEAGGYGTCDPGDALHRFLNRVTDAIGEHDSEPRVALRREDTYYRLYVEFGDEVYSY